MILASARRRGGSAPLHDRLSFAAPRAIPGRHGPARVRRARDRRTLADLARTCARRRPRRRRRSRSGVGREHMRAKRSGAGSRPRCASGSMTAAAAETERRIAGPPSPAMRPGPRQRSTTLAAVDARFARAWPLRRQRRFASAAAALSPLAVLVAATRSGGERWCPRVSRDARAWERARVRMRDVRAGALVGCEEMPDRSLLDKRSSSGAIADNRGPGFPR